MAKKTKKNTSESTPPPPPVEETEREEDEAASDEGADDEGATDGSDEGESEESESESEGESRAIVKADGGASIEKDEPEDAAARAALDDKAVEDEAAAEEGEQVAGQLGVDRWVLAAFFATGMVGAYITGRIIQGMWISVSNKDWFSNTFPRLAGFEDSSKATWSLVLGAIIALFIVVKTYKRPDVRQWTDDVANELAKVRWPTRKEVSSSTVIVIAASAAATLYLALLDRLWAFVTNLVYGDGS